MDSITEFKSKAYPRQDIFRVIDSIKEPTLRVYLALTFFMACRSGELLPYQHYKTTYEKNAEGKMMKVKAEDGSTYGKVLARTPEYVSLGVAVDDISYEFSEDKKIDMIIFNKLPVFKSKRKAFDKGYVVKTNNPFFDEIVAWIEHKKKIQADLREQRLIKDRRIVYLFDLPDGYTPERYYWAKKKQVQRLVKKYLPGFRLHSLRSSRATDAAELSHGDIFYVQGITRHRDIRNLQQYVQPVHMKEKARQYEGGN
jgi:integrase